MSRRSAVAITLLLLSSGLASGASTTAAVGCTCLAPASGESSSDASWHLEQAPVVEGTRVSSHFSLRRLHPLLAAYLPHFGDDIAAKTNAPLFASAAAVIERAGHNAVLGNFLVLGFGRGCTALYAHLASFAPGIHTGVRVKAHDLLGAVGSTGRSTAAHLHYQLSVAGAPVDPHCQCGTVSTPSLIAHSVTHKPHSRPRHPRTHHVFQQPKEGL